MSSDHMQDRDKARKDFQAESEELLDEIAEHLGELEKTLTSGRQKPDIVNAVFRGIHSLKGLSGMLGFSKITQLTHDLENLLDELRMGKISISHALLDFLYDCLDSINGLTQEVTTDSSSLNFDIAPLLRRIEDFLEERKQEEASSIFDLIEIDQNILKVLTEYEEYRLSDNIRRRVNLYSILANFSFETFDEELTNLNNGLREIGEIITTLPSIEPIGETEIQFNLILGTEKDITWLNENFAEYMLEILAIRFRHDTSFKASISQQTSDSHVRGSDREAVTSAAECSDGDSAPDEDDAPDQRHLHAAKTVRVNLDKIDGVLNMIGELAISRSIIDQIAQELREIAGFYRAHDLLKFNRNLEKQILRLQSRILEIRMVPLEQLFTRLARNVKKIAREISKDVTLHLSGEDTELDKMIIEELSDPLLHILRNAVDHAIEGKDVRLSSGKPESGNIWMTAYQKGNYVIIEVKDDGRGLDTKAIHNKAIAKGFLEPGSNIRDEQLFQFILLPGFSTREKASTLSGRGVGMDVVAKNISIMNGTLQIQSEEGVGTTFIISIPITMAVISALLVQVAGEKYAIPLTSIIRSVKLKDELISVMENREVLNYLDAPVPLIRLREYFALEDVTPKGKERFAVLVRSAEKKASLAVDKLLSRQDIVIKSLGKRLQNFPGIAGGTEIGDKRAIIVLDIPSLLLSLENDDIVRESQKISRNT